jgi:hypothetical protein
MLGPLHILHEQSVRNTHDSQTVFNDLSLHSFVIDEARRTTLRCIKAEGQTQPQQPQHLRTDEATHTDETARGTDAAPLQQPPLHLPVSLRLLSLCAALLQRPSLPSSSAAAPSAAADEGNDGGDGGMADSEIIRSHMTAATSLSALVDQLRGHHQRHATNFQLQSSRLSFAASAGLCVLATLNVFSAARFSLLRACCLFLLEQVGRGAGNDTSFDLNYDIAFIAF